MTSMTPDDARRVARIWATTDDEHARTVCNRLLVAFLRQYDTRVERDEWCRVLGDVAWKAGETKRERMRG